MGYCKERETEIVGWVGGGNGEVELRLIDNSD
jgi:hypothetical protein